MYTEVVDFIRPYWLLLLLGRFNNALACCLCLAAPRFRNARDRPHDVNVTEGDSVTFHCASYAEPEAEVVWMRNGEVITRKPNT